jgi:hypothetical protein
MPHQAGGFIGGDKSADFSVGLKLEKEIDVESLRVIFDDKSTGVA